MTSTRNLKIWTIVAHFCILVGFGHGILTLGLLEIFWFTNMIGTGFSFSLNAPFETRLSMVALMALLGQGAIIYSIFNKKIAFHLLGLVFLWLSIIYFIVDLSSDHYVHFGTITAVPFFICTLMVFIGRPLKQLYKRVQK